MFDAVDEAEGAGGCAADELLDEEEEDDDDCCETIFAHERLTAGAVVGLGADEATLVGVVADGALLLIVDDDVVALLMLLLLGLFDVNVVDAVDEDCWLLFDAVSG